MFLLALFACSAVPSDVVTLWSAEGLDTGGTEDWPELVINEFMAANATGIQDEEQAYPDWIELYNPGESPVELDGWTLSDNLGDRSRHELEELTIEAKSWLLLFADGDVEQGPLHLGFSLDTDGEEIGLYSPDGRVMEELSYGALPEDHSAARIEDGGSEWEVTDEPTPGESNTRQLR
jgi:hypothetical protein